MTHFQSRVGRCVCRVALLASALLAGGAPALAFGTPVPPADIPAARLVVPAQSAALAEQSMRVDRVEDQLRQLNGRLDELTWQLQQLQESLRRMQEDNEYRFQELEGGSRPQKRSDVHDGAPTTETAELRPGVLSTGAADAPADLSAGFSIDAPLDTPSTGAPRPLGTLPGDAGHGGAPSQSALGGPLDLSAIARGESGMTPSMGLPGGFEDPAPGLPGAVATHTLEPPAPSGAVVDLGNRQTAALVQPADPRTAYDQAYGYVVAGDYTMAEMSLKQFLADHPKDQLAGNARFWLGETYFARQNYRDAADSYLATYRDHPRSAKAPESLLKLGQSLEKLGEAGAACATYAELQKKYPSAPAALLSKVADQKSRAGC